MKKINFTLECVYSKQSIISNLNISCACGYKSFDTLYSDAIYIEHKEIAESCIANNYMNISDLEIKNITKKNMLSQKKEAICIRNNNGKQDFVCSKWYIDVQTSNIDSQVSDVTLADVEYFIKKCPPGDISDIQKNVICSQKEKFVSPAYIHNLFWKLNSTQVGKTYNSCSLTESQKKDICAKKQNSLTVEQVLKSYLYYPTENVSESFKSCQSFADLNEASIDKELMCNLQRIPELKYGNPEGENLWKSFKKRYGTVQIEDFIPSCALLSDDSEKLPY